MMPSIPRICCCMLLVQICASYTLPRLFDVLPKGILMSTLRRDGTNVTMAKTTKNVTMAAVQVHRDPLLEKERMWKQKGSKELDKARAENLGRISSLKVAFIFVLNNNISFPTLWQRYFEALDGQKQTYSLLVSVQGQVVLPEFFSQRSLPDEEIPQTTWCHAARRLLGVARVALRDDSAISHLVWLSHDSIPIRSPAAAVGSMLPGTSDFCVTAPFDSTVGHPRRSELNLPAAETWFSIAREHALTLVRSEKELLDAFGDTRGCSEEFLFYGPLAYLGLVGSELRNRCTMWTSWSQDQPGWHHMYSNMLDTSNSADKHRSANAHPFAFKYVPKEGLERLFSATEGFVFARKFDEHARVRDAEGNDVGALEQFLIEALNLSSKVKTIAARRPKLN